MLPESEGSVSQQENNEIVPRRVVGVVLFTLGATTAFAAGIESLRPDEWKNSYAILTQRINSQKEFKYTLIGPGVGKRGEDVFRREINLPNNGQLFGSNGEIVLQAFFPENHTNADIVATNIFTGNSLYKSSLFVHAGIAPNSWSTGSLEGSPDNSRMNILAQKGEKTVLLQAGFDGIVREFLIPTCDPPLCFYEKGNVYSKVVHENGSAEIVVYDIKTQELDRYPLTIEQAETGTIGETPHGLLMVGLNSLYLDHKGTIESLYEGVLYDGVYNNEDGRLVFVGCEGQGQCELVSMQIDDPEAASNLPLPSDWYRGRVDLSSDGEIILLHWAPFIGNTEEIATFQADTLERIFTEQVGSADPYDYSMLVNYQEKSFNEMSAGFIAVLIIIAGCYLLRRPTRSTKK